MPLIVNQKSPKGHPMPRARTRPSLSLDLSPARRRELAEFAAEVRRRGEEARARREAGAAADSAVPASGAPKAAGTAASNPKNRRARRAMLKATADRRARLEARLWALGEKRARLVAAGAFAAVVTVDAQRRDLRLRLANLDAAEAVRADKLARRGRGKSRDRFAVLVGRSGLLSPTHLEIADALRDEVLAVGMAGGAKGAVSGQAGDGDGNMIGYFNMVGDWVELGEKWWGAMGVPGVTGRAGDTGRKRTVRRLAKCGDGGMAAAADSVKRARATMAAFVGACREAAGDDAWAAEVAVRVILLNRGMDASIKACAGVRISDGRKTAETVMAAGLEAVAGRLGIAL